MLDLPRAMRNYLKEFHYKAESDVSTTVEQNSTLTCSCKKLGLHCTSMCNKCFTVQTALLLVQNVWIRDRMCIVVSSAMGASFGNMHGVWRWGKIATLVLHHPIISDFNLMSFLHTKKFVYFDWYTKLPHPPVP